MDGLILRTVLELTDDMLVLIGPDRHVRWMSKRAARIGRVDPTSAVGRDIATFFPDPSLQRAIERVVETAKPSHIPLKVDHGRLEMEARIVPIVLTPETVGASEHGTHQVTPAPLSRPSTKAPVERSSEHTVQAIIVAFSEVEIEKRLQTMRREFVANVSHELRSPLTSILGYAETLLHDPPDDPEQRHRFLLSVVREARRMQRLVEDLLNLSRIESGRAAPRFEGVNLHNIVGRVLTQLRDQSERAGVGLANRVPPDLRLVCDPGQVEQVVFNLVSNGIQYTPSNGAVTVAGWEDGDAVFIRVTDTGIGIPSADLPRVFERFYRVDKARSRATGATGLGLSIVKHIVDAHNGKVTVDSDPGGGAAFTVELPSSQPTSS